jgi:ATP synthase I chain
MKETQDNAGEAVPLEPPTNRIETRIFRTMAVAATVAVVLSLPFAQWRVTTGLLLGGILSLLNHHWLKSSAKAAFSVLAQGTKPKLRLVNYILRYLVIAAVVFLAYRFNLVSFIATIAGLCSFVVALFVEALREFYFAFIHREEIS